MRKFHVFILFLIFAAPSVSAQRNLSPISLVPDKSIAVLRVNWTEVRASEKLKKIVNGDSFAAIGSQIGISEAKITEWVTFSDINPTSSRGLGIIAAGNFTAQSVILFAKSKNWKAEKIGAATAYINPSDNSYVLPIRNGLVAAGTKAGMEKVQGVLTKNLANLMTKAPFDSMWTEVSASRQPINFIIGVPPEYQKIGEIGYTVAAKLMNLVSFGILGTIMEKIGFVNCFGFSISHKETIYPTRLFAMMDSETKAWLASSGLNLLKKAPAAFGTQPKNEEERKALASIQTLSAAYKGTLLSVSFDMPESAMQTR